MKLSITSNNGFSLEGLKLQNVYNDRCYAVIIEKYDYDPFKAIAKAEGFNIVNFDLWSSTPSQYVVKIKVPNSWSIKMTM